MELKDVAEVIEADSVTSANRLLNKGWTLIAVSTSSAQNGRISPCYVLARDKATGPLEGKDKFRVSGLT